MNTYFKTLAVTVACLSCQQHLHAADGDWFVRPIVGLSNLSNLTVSATNIDSSSVNGDAQVNIGSGFTAGLGLGYQYNDNVAVELAWEFRSNNSAVALPNGQSFAEGNYASNTFFLNGIYYFDSGSRWTPYLGAGLAWIQEVDIDLEDQARELSYSTDGDVGFQAFGGLSYAFNDQLDLQGELRYLSISDFELLSEEGAIGGFSGFDYQPTTVQLSLRYKF